MTNEGERVDWLHSIPFLLVHLAPLLALWTGTRWQDWALCAALYSVRMFFLTAGYHRYFAHRSFKLERPMQLVMAVGGATCAQKGVLWWAGHHRDHHTYSDTERDVHSPIKGFLWSHVGWFMCGAHKATKTDRVGDLVRYPELRWLNRWWILPPAALAIGCLLYGGLSAMLIGFFLSTALLYHGTFLVNSAAHLVGRRRFATDDASRNSLWIALLTNGEGWHNNHHHLKSSARHGFYWWEIDMSWYALKALSWVGLVRDLKTPTRRQLEWRRLAKDGVDDGLARFRALRERAGRALDEAIVAAEDAILPTTKSSGVDP